MRCTRASLLLVVAALVATTVTAAAAGSATSGAATHGPCASEPASRPRVAPAAGVLTPRATHGPTTVACGLRGAVRGPHTAPDPPYSGMPPLANPDGGSVMGTSGTVTVTPLYWSPVAFSYPSTYVSLTEQFLTDAVDASGAQTNVFSNLTQYTDGNDVHIAYDFAAGTPLADTTAYPTSGGCLPDTGKVYADNSGYTACVTSAQLQAELAAQLGAHGLPSGLQHLYVVYLPKGVEACYGTKNNAHGGMCSISATGGTFCGYHYFTGQTVFAIIPYAVVDSPVSGLTCSSEAGGLLGGGNVGDQSPNSNIDADTAIGVTSHELNEAITDPFVTAWFDGDGEEVADDCAYVYGDTSTFGGASGAEYNQTIHGHHYFIQEEFSNQEFAADPAFACVQAAIHQTVGFTSTAPAHPAVTDTYKVTATASSGLPATLTVGAGSALVCSLSSAASGATVTFTADGTCRIDADQTGTTSYVPAARVAQVIHVGRLDGLGTMQVGPRTATAAAQGASFTFHFTAGPQGTVNGATSVTAPPGWSAPSTTPAAKGAVTSTCGAVGIAGQRIVVTAVTLPGGGTCTTTYGARAKGPGATVAARTGTATFAVAERSSAGGTLTAIAVSPQVAVALAPTTTSITLSSPSAPYGKEQAEHVRVVVTARFAALAVHGKVTVRSGTTTVCTITVANGHGACALSPHELRRGGASIVATYLGTALFSHSTSRPAHLTITG